MGMFVFQKFEKVVQCALLYNFATEKKVDVLDFIRKRKMPSLVYSDQSDTREHSKKAPFLPRKLEACNDVELNPGPKSPTKKQSKTANNNNNQNIMNDVESREMMPAHDLPRVKKLGKILKQQH